MGREKEGSLGIEKGSDRESLSSLKVDIGRCLINTNSFCIKKIPRSIRHLIDFTCVPETDEIGNTYVYGCGADSLERNDFCAS
jgi:hypothetical protein